MPERRPATTNLRQQQHCAVSACHVQPGILPHRPELHPALCLKAKAIHQHLLETRRVRHETMPRSRQRARGATAGSAAARARGAAAAAAAGAGGAGGAAVLPHAPHTQSPSSEARHVATKGGGEHRWGEEERLAGRHTINQICARPVAGTRSPALPPVLPQRVPSARGATPTLSVCDERARRLAAAAAARR
jgi:hypothetical protein